MTVVSYKKIRIIVAILVSVMVSSAITTNNIWLAISAVAAGMLLMFISKKKTKGVLVDERMLAVGAQAARTTYGISTLVTGFTSTILLLLGKQALYLQSLGTILAYITIFNMFVYSLMYKYFDRRLGAGDEK